MLKAIIFDFDGIIVDSEPVHYRAMLAVAESFNVQFSYEHYLHHYIGFDDRDAFRTICGEHGVALDDARLRLMIKAKGREFERQARLGIQPFPGVVELITAASDKLSIGLCSGATRNDIRVTLSGIAGGKLLTLFKTFVTAEDVQHSKPDPESYALAAKQLGIAPADCLAIEDTAAGITSAKRAGLRTLGVGHSHPLKELSHADRTVPNLAGVSLDQLLKWFV